MAAHPDGARLIVTRSIANPSRDVARAHCGKQNKILSTPQHGDEYQIAIVRRDMMRREVTSQGRWTDMVVESTEAEVNGGGRIKSSSPCFELLSLLQIRIFFFPLLVESVRSIRLLSQSLRTFAGLGIGAATTYPGGWSSHRLFLLTLPPHL
ncbi:hypothetical protein PVAR5_8868 [Paecilomyces variotii No. 5]|uniref:Uncharacterized protein n=1 Tax=Byssochlamys spectabilis (strain No. 5 / NBRC 109023) TaxID=1356009 RepID=V5GDG9_BYSSN|nr:hypothetical protein PVAR5_8868 [Paecilomyces variotii No. 5]